MYIVRTYLTYVLKLKKTILTSAIKTKCIPLWVSTLLRAISSKKFTGTFILLNFVPSTTIVVQSSMISIFLFGATSRLNWHAHAKRISIGSSSFSSILKLLYLVPNNSLSLVISGMLLCSIWKSFYLTGWDSLSLILYSLAKQKNENVHYHWHTYCFSRLRS